MGWIITTIILTIIVTTLSFALRNLLIKNEKLEDFITKQSDAVNECDKRLKEIDDKGIFYADDQIGFFFKEVKKIQEALNEFTLK
jgi:peptidoglycan hydrolase CwlO-like protein